MTLFIKNGTLIDGTGAKPIANATILVDGGMITKVGDVQPPENATIIDAQGGTILPGFIDSHVHMMFEISALQERVSTPFSMNFY